MKDNKQNLTDLIGALAVDIEDVKKKLDAKDSSDKNEALKRLEAKLEPVIRFFNGNAPENVNAIFGSKEAIEEYKQSIGDEAVASLRLYTPKPTRRICANMEFPLSRNSSTRYWKG